MVICEHLRTNYAGKKHGGYNIYSDDKIIAATDTFVPNVDLNVKVGETREYVFGCNFNGEQVTYHPGKWEDYLDDLYIKALAIRQEKQEAESLKLEQERLDCVSDASEAANNVFA
jgi:hypothetical protein